MSHVLLALLGWICAGSPTADAEAPSNAAPSDVPGAEVAWSPHPGRGGPAYVEPPPLVEPDPTERELEPHLALVPDAPDGPGTVAPGEADGVVREPKARRDWIWIPRTIFYVPRRVIRLATYPISLGLVAYEKYAIRERVMDVFFNEDRTFGIYPTLFVETGFGVNGGIRAVHRDLWGHGENLYLRGGWGGLYRQIYEGRLGLGDLVGDRVSLEFETRFDIRPRLRFFGFGNDDEVDYELTGSSDAIDPFAEEGAVETRFRAERARWGVELGLDITDDWRLGVLHRWRLEKFGSPLETSKPTVTEVYDTDALVGWNTGLFGHYTEVELTFSNARNTEPWNSPVIPSTGWRLRAYGGYAEGIEEDPTSFFTSGFEVQRYIDLYRGDRVLQLRLVVDAVHGDRGRIGFIDYASLGGPDYLRGFVRDRFRDRFATLASVQYDYPIIPRLAGFLFVDAGRVWPHPYAIDIRQLDETRLGFGGGLIIYHAKRFLMRLQLAGSVDGGFFLDFRFNPSHEIRRRSQT